MKPTKILIEALRFAADEIEAPGSRYIWRDTHRCNCGMLAQECLSISENDLLGSVGGPWTVAAKYSAKCGATGRPIDGIFRQLLTVGLELDDFQYIENLDNPTVLERLGWERERRYEIYSGAGWQNLRCSKPAFVARYFRAQADLLEEQLTPTPPALVLTSPWPMVAMQVKPEKVGV